MSGKNYERILAYAKYHAEREKSDEVRRAFKRMHKFMLRVEKHCDNCGRPPDANGKFGGRDWCHCEDDS